MNESEYEADVYSNNGEISKFNPSNTLRETLSNIIHSTTHISKEESDIEKLKYFNYADKVTLYENNFFEQKVEKEYDFLFCYKSLHLNCNKHIPKERKMRKLLSSVK